MKQPFLILIIFAIIELCSCSVIGAAAFSCGADADDGAPVLLSADPYDGHGSAGR